MKVKKIKSTKIWRKVFYAVLFMIFGWYLHGKMIPSRNAGHEIQTPYVLVKGLTTKNISARKKYIAEVEAVNSVDIIPQVSGYLEEILFKDGSFVNEGEKIFVIEQRKYKADLKSAEARHWELLKEYDRVKKLHDSGDVPDKKFEMALSDLVRAEADVERARLDLDHSEIKAPISGHIGKALVTKGNLVSPNTQKLARIVQTNPIRIAFSVTDKERSAFMEKMKNSEEMFVDVVLPNSQIKTVNAKELFAGNEVNAQTATIPVYLDMENADNALVPGNYVDIYFRYSLGNDSLLVPQLALAADVHGAYVMTVTADGIVKQKYITLGDVYEDMQVVLSGLNADDKVIVQGLQKVKNGMLVNATLVDVIK
ncbi:MAG: efflux RND transporter periplasmic adaptor subunit [Alphaproteobacteria bacterium]|nr:efflux RND transporter periplasmic adaptor subunit [Alphaproteobacteria bacterium]